MVDHVRTSTPSAKPRRTRDATAATVFTRRRRGELKRKLCQVRKKKKKEKKAKGGGGVMAVKGPTVLVVCDVANETDEVSMT